MTAYENDVLIIPKKYKKMSVSELKKEEQKLTFIFKADFKSKLNIALKEASETEYWIELLWRTQYINEAAAKSILADCVELIKLLTSIIKHITKEQQKQ